MTVRVEKNIELGLYQLGDDVDGVFVAFTDLPIPQVDATVANTKAAQAGQTAGGEGGQPQTQA